jgi:hypothetical protein
LCETGLNKVKPVMNGINAGIGWTKAGVKGKKTNCDAILNE